MSIQDVQRDDRLTLESLLADPLTQLVMRSDNITVADTARAFLEAHEALAQGGLTDWAGPPMTPAPCWGSKYSGSKYWGSKFCGTKGRGAKGKLALLV